MTPPTPPIATPRKPWFPDWYTAIATITFAVLLLIGLSYAFGASGFRYRGATIDFEHSHDHQLFDIDGKRAFDVGNGGSMSVVKVRDVNPLVLPCGCNEPGGFVVLSVGFRKGDWVYTRYPFKGRPVAVNLETGEVLDGDDVPDKLTGDEALELPAYRKHKFDFEHEHALKAQDVAEEFKPLSTSKGGCITVLLAGYIVVALLLLVAPFARLQQYRRNRAT